MRASTLLSIALAAGSLISCLTIPSGGPSPASVPEPLIALLPFVNHSNDVEAPQKVRAALFETMKTRNYRLLELDNIDRSLREVDVTLGAQLRLFDDKRELLYKLVPADVHCYGTVVEFVFKNAVALTQRKVELQLKLVEAKTGEVLFEGQEIGITSKAGLDAAADATINVVGKVTKSVKESAKQLLPGETAKQAADLTDVVADVDLTQETNEAIRKLLARFPKNLSVRSP
ncbi:MAG: DUF799 family lipoprotein [Nitrospirae bacterium]|nr:DUF799 family lipoprotein [Nitrospirota bacterium]